MRAKGFSSEINPYVRQVHEHPGHLLADPEPEALAARLQAFRARSGGRGRLVADLGCGSGNYLLERATRAPRDAFVGFELRYKRLVKGARKLEQRGLDNVWLLRERAEAFGRYFGPDSLDEVHLNFPDPWPKRAHWKKRLVDAAFLDEVARTLRPGGRFHLLTDHSGYFLHVLAVIRAQGRLRAAALCNDLNRTGRRGGEPRTEFEQLFRSQGKPIFYVMMEKAGPTG